MGKGREAEVMRWCIVSHIVNGYIKIVKWGGNIYLDVSIDFYLVINLIWEDEWQGSWGWLLDFSLRILCEWCCRERENTESVPHCVCVCVCMRALEKIQKAYHTLCVYMCACVHTCMHECGNHISLHIYLLYR